MFAKVKERRAMREEDFERLFIFNKDLTDRSHIEELEANTDEWDTDWDEEVANQCSGLKSELETMNELEKRVKSRN